MYWCKSWTINKVDHWRIDAFELWCWIRLLRVPWTVRRSNQFILKEISSEYSLEGLMLKLKPLFWPPYGKNWLIWKDPEERLKAGEGDDRGWDCWMASPIWWTWIWACSRSWWWTGKAGVLQSVGLQIVRHDWATELNWTEQFEGIRSLAFHLLYSPTLTSIHDYWKNPSFD